MMTVAEHGSGRMLDALLALGADASATDPEGKTPLMFAAARGDTAIAGLLIQSVGDVTVVDNSGDGPLDHAFLARKPDMMAFLIRRGAEAEVSSEIADRWSASLPGFNASRTYFRP